MKNHITALSRPRNAQIPFTIDDALSIIGLLNAILGLIERTGDVFGIDVAKKDNQPGQF